VKTKAKDLRIKIRTRKAKGAKDKRVKAREVKRIKKGGREENKNTPVGVFYWEKIDNN